MGQTSSAGTDWRSLLGLSAHVRGMSVEELAAVAHRKGMRYLEIVAERMWEMPEGGGRERWRALKELMEELELKPLVHATYVEMNLASLHRQLRDVAVSQSLRCLELAAFLGAEHLVVHAGHLNPVYPSSYLAEARENLTESLRMLVMVAERVGVEVAVENGWNDGQHPLITCAEEHTSLIEAVASPALKALLDLGHAHTFGGDPAAYIEGVGPHLVGIHLHDNGGEWDEHLPLGRGTLGPEAIRRCFSLGVPVVLEMNSLEDLDSSLAYLETNLG